MFETMNIEQLTEVARTMKPFESDGKSGIRLDPVTGTGGQWSFVSIDPEGILSTAGVYKVVEKDGSPKIQTYRAAPGSSRKKQQMVNNPPPKRSRERPSAIPADKVVEVPVTSAGSNKHEWAIWNNRSLTLQEQLIAQRLRAYYFSSKMPVEVAVATLAYECDISERKTRDTIAALVARGYFRRLDNGQGGTHGKGKTRLVATLPEWEA